MDNLTEQLLDVLEAKEFYLDALLKLLGLERRPLQHLKTVREVINNYEEHNEQLSLQRWERIFEGLGYSEDFLRVVTHFNEQRHGQGVGPIPVANPGTVGDKKNDESGTTSGDGLAVLATYPDQPLAVSELDRKVTERLVSPSAAQRSSPEVWPPLSLPAPSSEVKWSGIDDSGVFSGSYRDNSVVLSSDNASSLLSSSSFAEATTAAEVVASPNSIGVPEQQCMNCVPSQFGCLPVFQTSTPVVSRGSATLVSKSSMPSASQTSAPLSVKSSTIVTRQPSICASNRMVDNQFLSLSAESISDTGQQLQSKVSRNKEHHESCSISSHGSEVHVLQPVETENIDMSENGGLLEEFQKENKELQSSVNYLVKELRTKDLLNENLNVQNSNLRLELKKCRARCADLEEKLQEELRTKDLLHKNLDVQNGNLQLELKKCRARCADLEEKLQEKKEELKALVQKQWEIKGDSSAPAAAACEGDSKGQNYELPDAESSSSASEASPSASLSLAAPVNDNLNDCIKCDDTDVMMTKVALAAASRAEIQKAADHLPSVGCVIRGFTVNHLPVFSMGWNGFIANIDKKDVDAFKSRYEPSKKRDRAVAKRYCLHAEVQALNSLPGNVLNATAYTTHSPCLDCAKLLCQRGIVRIFYVFWLNGCETSIELFKEQDITCMAFPHRDLILRDFRLGFLKNTGINRGGTDTDKPPGECPFFLSSKDRKQK